jgi:hypothetical protein
MRTPIGLRRCDIVEYVIWFVILQISPSQFGQGNPAAADRHQSYAGSNLFN